jgi:hypothetical protein
MIRHDIAANLGIVPDDIQEVRVSREAWTPGATGFECAPFVQQGGLGRVIIFSATDWPDNRGSEPHPGGLMAPGGNDMTRRVESK